jgi:hypothetical protein
VVGSLIIVIAVQRRAFQIACGPIDLDRIDTQPSVYAPRAVQAVSKPAVNGYARDWALVSRNP